ncbi:MAG: hypothetical protein IJ088_04775 [Clostridia bacterium]|nr:hypothetical protein [Clostridia bacterium]MBQ9008629.1 hypothetical protein [Clostridia bacterium]
MNTVNFRDAVLKRAAALQSLYNGKPSNYRKLLYFMETNDWFQLVHTGVWDEITVPELPESFPHLDLWLSTYGLPLNRKLKLLEDYFADSFPETHERFARFLTSDHAHGDTRDSLICLDYLMSVLDTDASSWTDPTICQILSGADTCLPKKTFTVLTDFCTFMSREGRKYIPVQEIHPRPTTAVSLRNYVKMCWLTLSERQIQNGDYVKKAASNARYAEIWLLTALHFVSAVRLPDLCALPVPTLQETGAVLRDRILNGTFDNKSATELADSWLFRIKMENPVPKKTRRYSGIPPITLSISTGCLAVFGKILALAASFCEQGGTLISKPFVSSTQLKTFFGPEFVSACGDEFFMRTRQLNKAYLQGVSSAADTCGNYHISGYMTAALLRSHKVPYAEMPESTDDYLRDGAFLGLTPEVVAAEMFARGCFGFIPTLLLSAVSNDWNLLDVHSQTTVLNEIGLTPVQIEHVAGAVLTMKQRVYENLTEIFRDGFSREKLLSMLKRISDGMAPGRDNSCCCIRSAADLPCADPQRTSCMGCGCELWTRTGIHILLNAYEYNTKQIADSGPVEVMRLRAINESVIIPSLTGILENLSTFYVAEEVADALSDMIKRRITNAKRLCV